MARSNTTAIQDRLDLTLQEMKDWMKIDGDADDATIEDTLIPGALEDADLYCNNPFTTSDGTELPIPRSIKVWCMRHITYHANKRGLNVSEAAIKDLGSVSYDPQSRERFCGIRGHRRNPGLGAP